MTYIGQHSDYYWEIDAEGWKLQERHGFGTHLAVAVNYVYYVYVR